MRKRTNGHPKIDENERTSEITHHHHHSSIPLLRACVRVVPHTIVVECHRTRSGAWCWETGIFSVNTKLPKAINRVFMGKLFTRTHQFTFIGTDDDATMERWHGTTRMYVRYCFRFVPKYSRASARPRNVVCLHQECISHYKD